MVQLIVGVKGAGKTKKMLDHVHDSIKNVDGNIVYLDKSSQNMHELDNKVRLINVSEYPIQNTDQFLDERRRFTRICQISGDLGLK